MLSRNEVIVTIETVLLDSDRPDLLLARNLVNAHYLCSLAEVGSDGYLFLAIEISSDRLADLRAGRLDLRSALVEPEMGSHFTGRYRPDRTNPQRPRITLTAWPDDLPERWLPAPGFLLTIFEDGVPDEEVVKDALARNVPVIVCTLNPPEAQGAESKIKAESLSEYLTLFQSLLRHATQDAIRRMKNVHRKAQIPADAFALNVFAFSEGSFNIHFEAKERPDLFGMSAVGLALKRVDRLMELASRPAEEARLGVRAEEVKGHFLSAYESLMTFASDKAPFAYRWSDPGMIRPGGGKVTRLQAAAMAAVLAQEHTLKDVPFVFKGRFTSINTDKKPWSWTARDEDNRLKRGLLHEATQNVLDGVRIRTQQYLVSGDERLVDTASGPVVKLFLREVSPQ